ncbi:MAG: UDP-N-acetylglucosamine 1-carboxyvinyltransferase [Proteobacteria bacterium]|nr:UDP-N-acetylglucosamine 1-carboxyvinyltransferase [Pseudomonadota bacterium]
MQTLIIEGGHKLKGTVKISGAKNAALPLMCACLLTAEPLVLENVPELTDMQTLCDVLGSLGVVSDLSGTTLRLQAQTIHNTRASYELVSKMRASVLVLGPLLARFGHAEVSLPGGCAIGARPIDVLLDGLRALGATIELENGYVHARVNGRLKGAELYLPKPAVTGTENLMMAATLAEGTTTISNAAREPEVVDLANCLNKMGAKITGAGTSVITIEGVDALNGTTHTVMNDRIEAGTYLLMAAMAGDGIMVEGAVSGDNQALLTLMKQAGVRMDKTEKGIFVHGGNGYTAVDVTTNPYPGFATDLQAQMMAFLTQANGTSIVKETVYENRFMHVPELNRMGARLTDEGHCVRVAGNARLIGADVMATDLRASASLVMAGLIAKGTTTVHRVYHLHRGYERLTEKLTGLGARISAGNE